MNKFQLRKKISKIRSKFARKKITANSGAIIKLIEQKSPNKKIGLYYPFGDELSTLELMNQLIRKKFIISLPIINKKFEMSFYSWSPNEPLTINRYGILEPFNGKDFLLSCEDGQEDHLEELAANLNDKFEKLKNDLGNIGENKLLLITAIKVMDEYFDTKKNVEKKKVELTNLTEKFKELKSLVYGYKDEKEDEATKLNNDINNLQKELDKINDNYDQLISNTAKEIEEFVERVNLKN